MAIKGKLKQKTGTNTSEILHPETDASITQYSNTIGETSVTTVKDALDEIITAGVGVTGVKGDAESTYHKGQVNITPANIGAIPYSEKGGPNGVATLDVNGLVPSTQLPSYVDDVLTVQSAAVTGHIFNIDVPHSELIKCESESELTGITTLSQLNAKFGTDLGVSGGSGAFFVLVRTSSTQYVTYNDKLFRFIYEGNTIRNQSVVSTSNLFETGKIYIDEDSNKTYRYYAGSLIEISKSLAIGETDSSAFAGNRGVALENRMDSLASVATSGSYNDLSDKPTIVFPDITVASTGSGNAITAIAVDSSNKHKINITKGSFLVSSDIRYMAKTNTANTFSGSQIIVSASSIDGFKVTYTGVDNQTPTAFLTAFGLFIASSAVKEAPYTQYENGYMRYRASSSTDLKEFTFSGATAGTILTTGDIGSGNGQELAKVSQIPNISGKADKANMTAGTYSAVSVNAQGIVTAGGQVLEVIENGATPTVANGGWFFEKDA